MADPNLLDTELMLACELPRTSAANLDGHSGWLGLAYDCCACNCFLYLVGQGVMPVRGTEARYTSGGSVTAEADGGQAEDAKLHEAASMAVVRSGLLEKAATSKAAARAPRFMLVPARIVAKPGLLAAATSKAAGGLAKAYPKGLAAAQPKVAGAGRRVPKSFSKAAAATRSGKVTFAGKAFALPPWRGGARKVAAKVKAKPGEEDDYDPFSEEPAPHVAMEKEFRKAARRAAAAAGKLDAVEWRPQGDPLLGVVRMPPKRKGNGVAPAQAKFRAVPRTAIAWLRRPGAQSQGGAQAEEYFRKDETQPAKKQKVDPVQRGFTKELLEKTPSTLQTCRSLLVFLEKKLEAAGAEPPAVTGPEALRPRLATHAESLGRLETLRAPTGWDARAKRVLDIAAIAASAPGEAALGALQEALQKESKELQEELKETSETLENLLMERKAWAKEAVRRDWLSWCERLLKAREAKLLAELGEKDDASEILNTGVDILEALVAGTTA
ncbi:unnamed protein product [Symbiodinium natans]|uniref:Uncharacterized protein n=1 Tax=Symbiodinium natans TaxID=878477 RepID=A0A812SAN9_9DINO|nr:unnamed protein product [Symbiodinium natans]